LKFGKEFAMIEEVSWHPPNIKNTPTSSIAKQTKKEK
jgi:hypothetical protein